MEPCTPAQQAANHANAQLSTGPRTEAGKARAAQNARRHGLASSHLVIADADREAFDSMRTALAEEVAPETELELTLFDAMLHAHWNIRRCRLLEAGLMQDDIDPLLLEQNEAKLRQIDRHARRHETNFYRALKALQGLQTEREFRNLARKEANPRPAPSPLANTRSARRALLGEQTVRSRIVAEKLDRALTRLAECPSTEAAPCITVDP